MCIQIRLFSRFSKYIYSSNKICQQRENMTINQVILDFMWIKNLYWKNKIQKDIIEIWQTKVWTLKAVQKIACQIIYLKISFLQVSHYHLKEMLNFVNKSFLLINLYLTLNIITRVFRTIIFFIYSIISRTIQLLTIL